MTSIQSSPGLLYTPNSPSGVECTRRSPEVQALQISSSWIDIYTGSLLSKDYSHRASDPELGSVLENYHQSAEPHGHPDPAQKWKNPTGYGAKHINDSAPFTLWDETTQDFRHPNKDEEQWLIQKFNPIKISFRYPRLIVITNTPPKPIPLTIAGVTAVFAPQGSEPKYLAGCSPCVGPRLPDPCSGIRWPRWGSPNKNQMEGIVEALSNLANIRRVNFFPGMNVVELVHGDGNTYPIRSLPGIVAGVTTTYHHDPSPFFDQMKNPMRQRLLDPQACLPGPGIGPLPQDGNDYLNEPTWGYLTPGMRVSTGTLTDIGAHADLVQSTTSGLRLRKGALERLTVANHGFPEDVEVFHPTSYGVKIGDIDERYEELDIAMVRLDPSQRSRYSNQAYFQAEPPKRLVEADSIAMNSYFEVDGMSTGLVTLVFAGKAMERPIRPPGHPEIPITEWRRYTIHEIFGASNTQLLDGLCGAPIVGIDTGNVAGFFHLAAGDYAQSAALDDLIAEGWGVV